MEHDIATFGELVLAADNLIFNFGPVAVYLLAAALAWRPEPTRYIEVRHLG